MVDHIVDSSEPRGRVDIQVGAGRRRRWSDEAKGRSVAGILRAGGHCLGCRAPARHLAPASIRLAQGGTRRRAELAGRSGATVRPRGDGVARRRGDAWGGQPQRDHHRDWRCGGSGRARRRPRVAAGCAASREGSDMIAAATGVKVLVATKPVDFRKGADGLAALVQEQLRHDPFSGTIFIFRSKRADRLKILAWDESGLMLLWKRLEQGAFRWPPITDGVMRLSASQLAALMDGLDWSRLHAHDVAQPT